LARTTQSVEYQRETHGGKENHMPREYEVFDRRNAAPVEPRPVVTLQKRANWGFNRAAFLALGEPRAIQMAYSPEGAVGFMLASPDDPRSYPVRRQSAGSNFQISGKAFCQHFGIPLPGYAKRFSAELEDDILWVDIKRHLENPEDDAESTHHGQADEDSDGA
jgi:hypothetical protein